MALSTVGLGRTILDGSLGLVQASCARRFLALSPRRTVSSATPTLRESLGSSRQGDGTEIFLLALLSCRRQRIELVPRCPAFTSQRHNSSNVPSRPDEKRSTLPDPSQTPSPAPSTSLISRLTALTSLKGAPTTGETGCSSVAKLVELAKPERKQLAMAVGLVSLTWAYHGMLWQSRKPC